MQNCIILILLLILTSCSKPLQRSRFGLSFPSEGSSSDLDNVEDDSAFEPSAIASFEETLFPIIQQYCRSCHGSNQSPVFAQNNAAASHDAIIKGQLIDASDVPRSRLVVKVEGGHNGVPFEVADEIRLAIENWLGAPETDQDDGLDIPSSVLEPTFSSISSFILEPKCVSCHGAVNPADGIRYDTYQETIDTVNINTPASSLLYQSCANGSMPPGNNLMLSTEELGAIEQWILDGALDN